MSSSKPDDSFARLGMHVGARWWVRCFAYSDHTPILDVDAGRLSVGICLVAEEVSDAAVEFARALVREAQVFAAEVERLHAEQTGAGDGSSDDSAADVNAA